MRDETRTHSRSAFSQLSPSFAVHLQTHSDHTPVALAGVRPAASPAVGRAATLQQRHAAAALGSDTPLPPSATWGCWERAGRQEVG